MIKPDDPKLAEVLEAMETEALQEPEPMRWEYPKCIKTEFILSAKPNQPIKDEH